MRDEVRRGVVELGRGVGHFFVFAVAPVARVSSLLGQKGSRDALWLKILGSSQRSDFGDATSKWYGGVGEQNARSRHKKQLFLVGASVLPLAKFVEHSIARITAS